MRPRRTIWAAPLLAAALLACDADPPAPSVDVTRAALEAATQRLDFPIFMVGGGASAAIAADFDADGAADIALLPFNDAGRVALQRGDGSGLELVADKLTAVKRARAGLAADWDLDGDTDLLATCAPCVQQDRPTIYRNAWAQTGKVGFAAVNEAIGLPKKQHAGIPIGLDVDQDGDEDLLLLATAGNQHDTILLENRTIPEGTLRFVERAAQLPAERTTFARAAAVLDVDGDGRLDVYVARWGADALLVQQPNGSFHDEASARGLWMPAIEAGAVALDLDRDGRVDIVTATPDGTLIAALAQADGSFDTEVLGERGPLTTTGLVAADVTGDGRRELIATTGSLAGTTKVFAVEPVADCVPELVELCGALALPHPTGGAPGVFHGGRGGDAVAIPALTVVGRSALYVTPTTDGDCDGVTDVVEEQSCLLDPADPSDAKADEDHDGVSNADELRTGTDPEDADSDDDGTADGRELATAADLDGDGQLDLNDNCPDHPNRDQANADGDERGDACDRDPLGDGSSWRFRRYFEARHAGTGERALLGLALTERIVRDQAGLVRYGASFALAEDAIPGGVEIVELFHPTTRDHAYAADATELAQLGAAGYLEKERLGWAPATAPGFGTWVPLRRFARAGGTPDEVVTIDPAEAQRLAAAGFLERAGLGLARTDEGRLRKPTSVVRFRAPDGRLRHAATVARWDDQAWTSEGKRFRVAREASGHTVPLVQLVDAQGREVLATDATEISALEAAGALRLGILGYVYRLGAVDATAPLVPLVRVQRQDGSYLHSADAAELAATGAGLERRVLGRVVGVRRSPDPTCEPDGEIAIDADREFEVSIGRLEDANAKAGATLVTLVTQCAVERVLTGRVGTPLELKIQQALAGIDPYTRDRLLARAQAWHDLDPSTRAAALGSLAALDPGDCSSATDAPAVKEALTMTLMSGPGTPDNGAVIRAPQCHGATYDPSAGVPTERADRAIVTTPRTVVRNGEFDTVTEYTVDPQLYGIIPAPEEGVVSGNWNPAEIVNDRLGAFGREHEAAGMPLTGVDVGPCAAGNTCPTEQGQMCVAGRCRAYPVVAANARVTMSGASLWDKIGGQLAFSPTDGSTQPELFKASIGRTASTTAAADLCKPRPFAVSAWWEPSGLPVPPVDPNAPPVFDTTPSGVGSDEKFVDSLKVDLGAAESGRALKNGKFYHVQYVAKNGNYFLRDEEIPTDRAQQIAQGRVVHKCLPGLCTPAPTEPLAACALPSVPGCDGTVGGVWVTPPRPLSQCAGNVCPETPSELWSPAEMAGVPLLVYVREKNPKQYLNAELTAVHCDDETGVDWGGADEFMAYMSGVVGSLSPATVDGEDIEDAQSAFGAWAQDFDAGDTHSPRKIMSSLELRLGMQDFGSQVIQLGEDDDSYALIAIVTVAAVVAIVAMPFLIPAAGVVVGGTVILTAGTAQAAISGALAGTLTAIGITDPDDFLGQRAWAGGITDISDRGLSSHAVSRPGAVSLLARVLGMDRDVAGEPVSSIHPAVEGVSYANNGDLRFCASDAACGGGQRCAIGVCVAQGWNDPSWPAAGLGGSPGPIESTVFGGSGASYRAWISFTLTNGVPGKK